MIVADPRCNVCDSTSVSPPGDWMMSGSDYVVVRFGRELARVEHARVCLDCGTLMPAVSDATRQQLRQTVNPLDFSTNAPMALSRARTEECAN
jgi:hypothetical protein